MTTGTTRSAAKNPSAPAAGRLRSTGNRLGAPAHDGKDDKDDKDDKGRGLRSPVEAHIYREEERDTETAVHDPHGHAHTARPPGRGRNWPGPWRKTPGRLLGTSFVRLYQLTLSGFVGNSCRHLPTCSEYAHEAIARHGLWAGGWMGFFRVLRCGPFGTYGIDLVPEVLADRYVWFMPWRYWRIGRNGAETKT